MVGGVGKPCMYPIQLRLYWKHLACMRLGQGVSGSGMLWTLHGALHALMIKTLPGSPCFPRHGWISWKRLLDAM